MKRTRCNNEGFSLVELIIVIAIMAILAGAIAPALIRYIDKARASRATEEARTIVTAVETALATKAGEDADFQIGATFVTSDRTSVQCGLITNWILSKTQSGDEFTDQDPEYANYLISKEILANLQSEDSNNYMFFNFTGSGNNPIGMSCGEFASRYEDCPGVIIAYGSNGKVIMLEYYNYGCLIHYENNEYEFMDDQNSFISSSRLQ